MFPYLGILTLLLGLVSAEGPTTPELAAQARLPQRHLYQQKLRAFLWTLSEKDFKIEVGSLEKMTLPDDREEQYRLWLLVGDTPLVGRKRCAPSVSLPPGQFTLQFIEGEKGIVRPWVWPEPTTWLANWSSGPLATNARALKLRAFVSAAVDLMMMDEQQETEPEKGGNRSDFFAPHLAMHGYTFRGVKDVLPPVAQEAFGEGLKKLSLRLINWGPKGEETHFELLAAVGLWYAADALDDADFTRRVEDYARQFFVPGPFFHPAGYFTDQGGFDASYNGMSLYFATWLAAASDWPFAKEALEKAWRLRAHLSLPEPDGKVTGPCHFNTRTSAPANQDQWDWAHRQRAAAMLFDEAALLAPLPSDDDLKSAPEKVLAELRAQINENPGLVPSDQLVSPPWQFRVWPNSPVFPMVNYAFDHCRKGASARLETLAKNNSPLLRLPFQRAGEWTEAFEKEFIVARRKGFGVVLHTGEISGPAGKGYYEFPGPYGLGGGALSAFWTPEAGSVILGRRGGMAYEKNFDKIEDWRQWPTHAVTGTKPGGEVFSTAFIRRPDAEFKIGQAETEIHVRGAIPPVNFAQGKVLEGRVEYTRTFRITSDSLRIDTTLTGHLQDKVTELYEILPVYLGDAQRQPDLVSTRIEFSVDGKWVEGTPEFQERVSAIRLTRFKGSVLVRFIGQPRRVRLSAQPWKDAYMTRAACRNILIDLLDSPAKAAMLSQASVAYEFCPGAN